MKQKIIAIYRSQQHSPNLSSADARIMNNVVDALKENYEIVSVTEEEFIERDVTLLSSESQELMARQPPKN